MAKTVAILNQKGGVGKTTTAVNLTACVGALGKRVLLCDIDPQGNSTGGFGVDKRKTERSSYHVLIGECGAKEALVHTAFQNVDLIPSTMDLAGAELELSMLDSRESRIRRALAKIKGMKNPFALYYSDASCKAAIDALGELDDALDELSKTLSGYAGNQTVEAQCQVINENYVDNVVLATYRLLADNAQKLYQSIVNIKK